MGNKSNKVQSLSEKTSQESNDLRTTKGGISENTTEVTVFAILMDRQDRYGLRSSCM